MITRYLSRIVAGSTLPALLGIALAACADAPAAAGRIQPGDVVPAYAAVSLAGDSVSLASLRGRPLLLNVWATWCPPCREEMPALEALHTKYAPAGLQVVGVSIDGAGVADLVGEFVQEFGVTFAILHDPGNRISRTFHMNGVPETLLIDANGRLVRRWIGIFDPTTDETRTLLERTLQPTAPS